MKAKPQYRKRIDHVLKVLNEAAAKELPEEWQHPTWPTARNNSKQPRKDQKPPTSS